MKNITPDLPQYGRSTRAAGFWIAFLTIFTLISCSVNNSKLSNCRDDTTTPCIPRDEPHKALSEYNIYTGTLRNLEPVDGFVPYDLNTQLFSDYAQKLRFIYIPDGTSVDYREHGILEFPVGSVIVKNFFYAHDLREPSAGRRIMETRLLIRTETDWTANTYVWNEEQTEASLQLAGDEKQVTWINAEGIQRKVNYLIPTKNDCKTCHSSDEKLIPLGPEARNLNKSYSYADGEQNQLARWTQAGILNGRPGPDQISEVPDWQDPATGTLRERARIYLDVNCANCHSSSGSANNSGLFLNYQEEDPFRLGVCKSPIASGAGSGGLRYGIVPCQPDKSILLYRMESVEPAVRMPEMGRTLVHQEAVDLIKEWIANMECRSCQKDS